jgi:hypothetical protein
LVFLPDFEVEQEIAVNNQKNIQKAAKKKTKAVESEIEESEAEKGEAEEDEATKGERKESKVKEGE